MNYSFVETEFEHNASLRYNSDKVFRKLMQINRMPCGNYDPKKEKYRSKYKNIGEMQSPNPEVIKQYCEQYEKAMSIVRKMNKVVEDEELIENREKALKPKLKYRIIPLDNYEKR